VPGRAARRDRLTGGGLRAFTEALALATANRDGELALHLLNNMTYTAYERGDLGAAEELVRRMRLTSGTAAGSG
jgi:hypothetical protein